MVAESLSCHDSAGWAFESPESHQFARICGEGAATDLAANEIDVLPPESEQRETD